MLFDDAVYNPHAVLFGAPQIPSGIHWNPQEWHRNPQESTRMAPEWYRNPQESTGMALE
jgi:hypothetical protein